MPLFYTRVRVLCLSCKKADPLIVCGVFTPAWSLGACVACSCVVM